MKHLIGIFILLFALGAVASAQTTQQQPTALGGVAISADGLLQMRKTAPVAATRRAGDPALTYVSLTRLFDRVKDAKGQRLPRELRYLQGLTRVDYLFVYPGPGGDIVLAGPSEPFRDDNPLQPVGTLSGRPVLQLDDLIVALRAMQEARNDTVFGCSLDLAPGAQKTAQEVARRFNGASNAALAQQVKNALGPQQVRILGIPGDSRLALAMVTADYRLKRTAMGAESLPGVGNAVSTGVATNRVWFEPAYDAVAVSEDGLSYQIAGPRLKVLAGRIDFDTKDATPAATAFAKRFSEKIPDAAMRIIEYADLQNVTDLFLVAALIKQDNLAKKSALDFTWILSATNYKPASLPVPKTAETIMADANGMITEGGVLLAARSLNGTVRGKADMQLASRRTRPDKEWFLTRKIER